MVKKVVVAVILGNVGYSKVRGIIVGEEIKVTFFRYITTREMAIISRER